MTPDDRPAPPLVAPFPLPPNLVTRSFRGGARLAAFRSGRGMDGGAGEDGHRPEDWLASIVRAWNPVGTPISDEGLTRVHVGETEVTLRDLVLRRDPGGIGGAALVRGAGPTIGFLARLVDASQRLPVHCHPTRAFAERFLGSRFGGAEGWIVLGTHPVPGEKPPGIWLGFRRDVGRDELRAWIEGERTGDLVDALHWRPVLEGESWFVPAGAPHAVGAGVFVLATREPTDFSIVAETGGFPIRPQDAHLGQGWAVMVDAFDRRGFDDAAIDGLRRTADGASASAGVLVHDRLFGSPADPFFRAERVTLGSGSATVPWPDTFVVGVVTQGRGRLVHPRGELDLRPGACFGIPARASDETLLEAHEPITVLCCLPPDPDALAATGWRMRPVNPIDPDPRP